MGFDAETALRPAGDGRLIGEISPGWETPRGPLGGYVMAILMRGLERAVADPERQARALTMHFLRVPRAGSVEVRADVERTGRSLTTVSGRLEQDGKLIGLALGAYSKPWDSPLLGGAGMPEVDPPEEQRPTRDELGREPPAFTQKLTMQHRIGPAPFSGADRGEVGGWLGLREERPIDALAVAVLADAWFPAPWPRLTGLAPAPTVDLTIHFRAPLPLPDDVLLGRFTNSLVRDGFFEEDGELWAPNGTLVAQSRQLGLLLGAEAP
ncbi:MAG TPA: thioesterase family protein [Solirubrobacterales bacterium]|nr:thioesterase family protein [Solirubrobacterales bacterium]